MYANELPIQSLTLIINLRGFSRWIYIITCSFDSGFYKKRMFLSCLVLSKYWPTKATFLNFSGSLMFVTVFAGVDGIVCFAIEIRSATPNWLTMVVKYCESSVCASDI